MATSTAKEMTDAELHRAHDQAKEELFGLRFQVAASQLDNTSLLKNTKKKIAQIKTEVRAREIKAALASVEGNV